ncbi:acyl-CoA/acyl-ACP dehydrogenase [Alphaproteobacteria bacterium]|nr:acyl-CoA/acyl-ACP dehydrogenase [bacterium]MDC0147498.1 acyl-CoA/acyl-ACP dehydrogenase [Alphaproteobacteria bacterium]
MYFGLSEDQTLLQDSVGRYLESACDLETVRRFAEGDKDVAQDLQAGLMDLGVPLVLVPEEYGGLGLGVLEAALIQQAIGRQVAPASFASAYAMAVIGLRDAASEAQKTDWLGRIASGTAILGVGLTEAVGAREGAGVTLKGTQASGRASFVMGAELATHFMLTTGHDLLILERHATGVKETALTTIDKSRHVVMLDLENVECEVLSGDAMAAQGRMIDVGRVLLAADSLGAADRMLEKSVAYSKEREQFNRPIGSFQAVKHMCADMVAKLEPCRSLVWYAAYAQDHVPDEAALMSRMAKSHLSEVGKFIARTSTEVHGGMGFTDLLGLHYWFKRLGANRQLLGGPETVREETAKLQGWC